MSFRLLSLAVILAAAPTVGQAMDPRMTLQALEPLGTMSALDGLTLLLCFAAAMCLASGVVTYWGSRGLETPLQAIMTLIGAAGILAAIWISVTIALLFVASVTAVPLVIVTFMLLDASLTTGLHFSIALLADSGVAVAMRVAAIFIAVLIALQMAPSISRRA